MSNSYETTINGINYFQGQTKLYDPIKINNSYEITSSLPSGTGYNLNQPEWKLYKDIVLASASSETTTLLTDDIIKQDYLDTYSNVIQNFILAGKQSVYLRPLAATGSSITGGQLFKQSPFYDLVDIQQLKEYATNIFSSDPCLLMDADNVNAVIEPLKLALVKVNFKTLCRTVITTLKLQNIFLSSVFNNHEFYKSDKYYDSTFADYAFNIMMQKLDLLIPSYKKSIRILLKEELTKKLSDGEEILDPLTNEKVEFITPLDETNFPENIERYMRVLFAEELIFISDKTNVLFNVSGSDALTFVSHSFAPSSTFATNKLYTAKEYFIESLPVVGLGNSTVSPYYGFGLTIGEKTTLHDNKSKLFLEISSSQDLETKKITTFLSLGNIIYPSEEADVYSNYFIKFFNVSMENNLLDDDGLSGEELLSFITSRIPVLKQKLLEDEKFLIFTNFLFPTTKILNIASLFYINMSLKLYQSLNDITKGSIKAVSTIHNMILNNDQACDTPTPIDFQLDDMIMGINLEILKAIILAPIQILKGIEETFDPNIFIASKARTLAETLGAPKLPIIPYSAPLMIPPPFGFGIMPVTPWGYYYWAVDAAELALLYAKDGFQTNSLPSFNISKDPFKPDC